MLTVKRVTRADLKSTYCCMNELPPGVSWAEGLPESREWFAQNLDKHVEGYHLLDDGKVVGHVYYGVSENAAVPYEIESNVAIIYCTEMVKSHARKGHGKLMFDYVKDDLMNRGFKGILVDATGLKVYMFYEDFLKQGFRVIKEHSPWKLMYFPLSKESVKARLIELNYRPSKDRVEVTLLRNFTCPVGANMYHRMKRIAEGFGERVKIVELDVTPEVVHQYGITDPLINGKVKIFGPASEDDVKKAILEEIDQFKN